MAAVTIEDVVNDDDHKDAADDLAQPDATEKLKRQIALGFLDGVLKEAESTRLKVMKALGELVPLLHKHLSEAESDIDDAQEWYATIKAFADTEGAFNFEELEEIVDQILRDNAKPTCSVNLSVDIRSILKRIIVLTRYNDKCQKNAVKATDKML